MYNNARSYVSRFSGLLLFLLTLLVVGVLVLLTIRAARNSDTANNDATTNGIVTTSDDNEATGFTIDGDAGEDSDIARPDTTTTDNGVVIVGGDIDGINGETSASSATGDDADATDSNDDGAVAGATNTSGDDSDDGTDEPVALAVTGGAELPNTGADFVSTPLVLAVIVGLVFGYGSAMKQMLLARFK